MIKALALVVSIAFASLTSAQNLTAVVPGPVSSVTDVNARLLLKKYDELYGTSSMVLNRPGNNGQIGLAAFLKESAQNQNDIFTPLIQIKDALIETDEKSLELIKYLVENGANVNCADRFGRPPNS